MIDAKELRREAEPATTTDPRNETLTAIRGALATMLGWRRDPALALHASAGSAPGDPLARTATPGDGTPEDRDDWRPSRSFDYAGLAVRVLAEPRGDQEPSREMIPPAVIDTVLRMIVEAHFAVWYVWHVPTAFCLVPGLEGLLRLPCTAAPTFTEEWFGLVHPDDLPRLVAENDRALREISSFRSEYRLRCGEGTYVWVSDWAIVLAGPDGTAEWMAGGIRDITVDKALEASRQESTLVSDALARSEVSLRNQTQALEERNVALKVLVDQRREDLDALRQSVTDNVEQLVMPTLDLLAGALAGRPESALVEAVRLTIDEITRPLLARPDGAAGGAPRLSRREYQVLQLIRSGRTTDEIAHALCLSPTTVTFHRGNIRQKMGLHGTGRRLTTEVVASATGDPHPAAP